MDGVYHGQSTHSNVSKVHRPQELLLTHQSANATTEPVAGKTDLSPFPALATTTNVGISIMQG